MRLDGDPVDRHILDAVTRERLKQLARMEHVAVAHWPAVAPRLTAARPALSSDATVFQFNASSSRSDIGRRRASMTASGTASGSRTATGSAASTGRGCSADDPTVGSVPGTDDRTAAAKRPILHAHWLFSLAWTRRLSRFVAGSTASRQRNAWLRNSAPSAEHPTRRSMRSVRRSTTSGSTVGRCDPRVEAAMAATTPQARDGPGGAREHHDRLGHF